MPLAPPSQTRGRLFHPASAIDEAAVAQIWKILDHIGLDVRATAPIPGTRARLCQECDVQMQEEAQIKPDSGSCQRNQHQL